MELLRHAPPFNECKRLWAADMNIGYVLTEEQLQHYFSCFGTVLDVYLPRSAQRGRADYVMPARSSALAQRLLRSPCQVFIDALVCLLLVLQIMWL